jgi:Domain of unknown function (DUF3291)
MWHLAQLNIAHPLAPLDDARMAGFVGGLAEVNALADAAPGFIWRLRDEDAPDATSLRPYGPDIMVNYSVWESVEALRDFVYRGPHLESLRRRREWFDYAGIEAHLVLWWVPAGVIPTLDEARDRLELLARKGPGPEAFTLRKPFPPPDKLTSG